MIENFDVFKDERQNCYQLRTKTNSYALEFDDKERESIFLDVISFIKKNKEITLQELKQKVQTKTNESKVIDVLTILNEYHLLSFEISNDLKVKSEDINSYYASETKQCKDFVLSIFGEGILTHKIENLAKTISFKEIKTYLYNSEFDIENAVIESDFIIVDANEWSPFHIELINKNALKHNKPWLYVGGIEEISIKIGPLFYGKETGVRQISLSSIFSSKLFDSVPLITFVNYSELCHLL